MIVAFLLVLGLVWRATAPEARVRFLRSAVAALGQGQQAAVRGRRESEPFRAALRARTPLVLVTPTLVVVNLAIVVRMLSGAGPLDNPDTLLQWGASFGPRTTNGEWWRLVTSMFVHSGILHFLVNAAALLQIGLILERLAGRLAFTAVFMASGLFASVMNLSASPAAVSVGASGGVFGLYGLLLASWIWGVLHQSSVTMPLVAMQRLAPVAVAFVFYNLIDGSIGNGAELTGLAVGFACGIVLTRGIGERTPPERLATTAVATVVVLVVLCAVPLRGLIDVGPELGQLVALEQRTAGLYQTALHRVADGRITAAEVARMIDRTILPDLEAADTRLKALDKVPPEHLPLIAAAEEYLKLRSESWRLRAEELRARTSAIGGRLGAEAEHRTSLARRGRADGAERASLEAFQKIVGSATPSSQP